MKVSGATISDQVYLRAHIKVLNTKKYNCDSMYKRLPEDKVDAAKRARGCGYVVKHIVDKIDSIVYKTCLCKLKHPLTYELLSLYRHYKAGFLPFNGGIMEQPAQVMELLEIVDSEAQKLEIERMKKEKNSGRSNRTN